MRRRGTALADVPFLAAACTALGRPGRGIEDTWRVALAPAAEAPRTNFATFARSVLGGAAGGRRAPRLQSSRLRAGANLCVELTAHIAPALILREYHEEEAPPAAFLRP